MLGTFLFFASAEYTVKENTCTCIFGSDTSIRSYVPAVGPTCRSSQTLPFRTGPNALLSITATLLSDEIRGADTGIPGPLLIVSHQVCMPIAEAWWRSWHHDTPTREKSQGLSERYFSIHICKFMSYKIVIHRFTVRMPRTKGAPLTPCGTAQTRSSRTGIAL